MDPSRPTHTRAHSQQVNPHVCESEATCHWLQTMTLSSFQNNTQMILMVCLPSCMHVLAKPQQAGSGSVCVQAHALAPAAAEVAAAALEDTDAIDMQSSRAWQAGRGG